MKNKKGDLLNNVLTTIIAVLGIALLIYGAWKLYSVYLNTDELNAKAAINTVDGKFGLIAEGQNAKVVMKGVAGWSMYAWPKTDRNRPEKCYLKSCICICPNPNTQLPEKIVESCQKEGLCRFYDTDGAEVFDLVAIMLKQGDSIPQNILDSFLKTQRNENGGYSPEKYNGLIGSSQPGYLICGSGGVGWATFDPKTYSSYYLRNAIDFTKNNLYELYIYKDKTTTTLMQVETGYRKTSDKSCFISVEQANEQSPSNAILSSGQLG